MNSVLQNLCYLVKFNVARRYLCESQGMAGYSSGCNLPKANKKSGSSFGGLVFFRIFAGRNFNKVILHVACREITSNYALRL